MKKIFYSYNSIGDFVRDVDNTPTNDVFKSCEKLSSQQQGNVEFYGTESYEKARQLLLMGDHESADLIRKSGNIKTPKRTNANRNIPTTGIIGYMPHIPNLLMGRPDWMICDSQIVQKQRVITIVVNGCVSCMWSAKEIADVQAKIITAIRMVEAGGIRVNLWWYSASMSSDEITGLLIKVKDSGKMLQTEKMGYILINPSMLRRHEFRFIETRKELKRTSWTSGYGRVASKADAEQMLQEKGFKYSYFTQVSELKNVEIEDLKQMFSQK